MTTAQFVPDLASLHQHLAWTANRPQLGLDIRIASYADGVYAHINGARPVRLSDVDIDDTGVYVRQLSAMLAHYPAPVRINDRRIETKPYRDEPGIRVWQHDGNLLEYIPTFNTIIQGKGYPAILLDRILYELDTRPAEQNPPNDDYAGVLEYRVADGRDGQPHFARLTTYQILPGYRHDATDLADWSFREGYGAMPHRCLPPADVMHILAVSQRTPQEAAGTSFIHRHSGGSPQHGSLKRMANPHGQSAQVPHAYTTHAWPVPLVAFGQEIDIDQEDQQEQHVNLSIARALYAAPELALVPVRMPPGDPERPNVSCQVVTIITGAGATLELRRVPKDLNNVEFVPTDDAPTKWETGCRQITATLTVTEPDGNSRQVLLPMDAFLSGDIEDEEIWLTTDWTADRTDELKDLLILAYWPELEDPEHITECQYRKRAAAMAANLLQTAAEGLTLELTQLADSFWPLNRTSMQSIAYTARPRHSLIWQPEHSEDIPIWLTAAVAGQNPEADPQAVGQQARAILTDPDRLRQLRELLAITPAA